MGEQKDLLRNLQVTVIGEEGYSSWSHWHSDDELLFVTSGAITVEVEKQIFDIAAGQGLHIGGGMIHLYHPNRTQAEGFVLKYAQETLAGVFAIQELNALYNSAFRILPCRHMPAVIEKIASAPRGVDRKYILYACLVEITAYLMAFPELQSEKKAIQEGGNRRYLQAIQKYLADHQGTTVSLSTIAEHLGITANYCSKYIREHTGMTYIEYLNRFRISNAQRLLAFSDLSVTDIAFSCGFGSVQTLNRVFKKIVGVSPSTFQKNTIVQKKGIM